MSFIWVLPHPGFEGAIKSFFTQFYSISKMGQYLPLTTHFTMVATLKFRPQEVFTHEKKH